jgi:phosphatidylserine/phosphatidylglycerophosphate/cardiolipin synthase-like enzyme
MSFSADLTRYFRLKAAGDAMTATEPEPATFDTSRITPCIDMSEYFGKLKDALDKVGLDPDPSKNKGDFIYIANWWIGLTTGTFVKPFILNFANSGAAFEETTDGVKIKGFPVDPENLTKTLLDLLIDKAKKGVDVRVIGWVSYALLAPGNILTPFDDIIAVANPGNMVSINAHTMDSIKSLRAEPTIGANAILNTVGHSGGATHLKAALVGTKPDVNGKISAIGFTGGLDFVIGRWSTPDHLEHATWQTGWPIWHDIQAAIEGKATQGLYDHFRAMWKENLRRDPYKFHFEGDAMLSYAPGATEIPQRVVDQPLLSNAALLTHHVQSLRTVPTFNYAWHNCAPEGKPAEFAPNGLFELRASWRKAILSAQKYIYMEDQSYAGREIMEWINEALRTTPGLKVILVCPGAGDPNDAPTDDSELLDDSINRGLLGIGGTALSAAQQSQIRMFRVWGDSQDGKFPLLGIAKTEVTPAGLVKATTDYKWGDQADSLVENKLSDLKGFMRGDGAPAIPIVGNDAASVGDKVVLYFAAGTVLSSAPDTYTVCTSHGTVIHAKTTIIDDKWALIGSANCMRRSLYTDWEHSVAFIDETGTDVQKYRARLWAEHFNNPVGADFTNIDHALGGWEPTWNSDPPATSPTKPTRNPALDAGPPYLQAVTLPFPLKPMSSGTRSERDTYRDVDSRQPWSAFC